MPPVSLPGLPGVFSYEAVSWLLGLWLGDGVCIASEPLITSLRAATPLLIPPSPLDVLGSPGMVLDGLVSTLSFDAAGISVLRRGIGSSETSHLCPSLAGERFQKSTSSSGGVDVALNNCSYSVLLAYALLDLIFRCSCSVLLPLPLLAPLP